jgi:subtilisin family serine protease
MCPSMTSQVLTWWLWMLCLSTALGTSPVSRPIAARILAKPRSGVRRVELHRLYAEAGCHIYREHAAIGNLQVLEVPAPLNIEAVLKHLRASDLFEYVEADVMVQGSYVPNDPLLRNGTLWSLDNIGLNGGTAGADIDAPEAWDIHRDASGIIVAVIDSGVRYTHQDLNANMWRNWGETPGNGRDDDGNGYVDDRFGINAISNSGNPADAHGHGTHVAGIIGAVPENGIGGAGVAFRVQIMALRFEDAQLHGWVSDAIECIDYARRYGARIINASWADRVEYDSDALRDAIAAARDAGIIFIAAANNEAINNDDAPVYPANFPLDNIVSVAATDNNDELALWSNYGPRTVHLAAPGQGIYSTWATGDNAYHELSGTSMAAPHVAGSCALVWARFPWLNYREVIERVLRTTDPLPSLNGRVATGGRLNLRRALEEVNAAPVIAGLADQTVPWGTTISATASASDPDNNELKFSLDPGAPPGAAINEWTGVFSWTPAESQAPGTYLITVRVTDSGSPAASATTSFTIFVTRPNSAPVIAHIADQTVPWATTVIATASASDPDNNEVKFSLDPGAPSGATINEWTGAFSWTPTQSQAPGSYAITVRVTDNGSPPASAATSFTVIVTEINSAPLITGIADRIVLWGTTVTATAAASDPDNDALTFTLDAGAPAGAMINGSTGAFSWTPAESQTGTHSIIVRVTDSGSPPATATTSFTIVVAERVSIASIRQTTPGEVVLTWNSSAGAEYRIEFTDRLDGHWQNHSSITAHDSVSSVSDNIAGSRRFYRIVRVK